MYTGFLLNSVRLVLAHSKPTPLVINFKASLSIRFPVARVSSSNPIEAATQFSAVPCVLSVYPEAAVGPAGSTTPL